MKPNPKKTISIQEKIAKVESAYEPTDIIWESFGIKEKKKIFYRILEFLLTIIFMCASTAVFLGLN